MDKNTDQTNFWLAWKATCAAVKCADERQLENACREMPEAGAAILGDLPKTVELSKEIIKSTNGKFKSSLSYFDNLYGHRRNSDFMDEVAAWSDAEPQKGCAFLLLEEHLYNNQTIKGRPFKDYLFETIGSRSGGLGMNLYGYVKLTLRTIARSSFSKVQHIVEGKDDEGKARDVNEGSTDDRLDLASMPAPVIAEVNEVVKFFGEYVDALGFPDGDEPPVWDQDNWISLYCALHQIPVNNPDVARLCRRSHTMLSAVKKQTVGNLLLALRGHLKTGSGEPVRASDRVIALALDTGIPDLLDERMRDMPFYDQLEGIRKALLNK